MTRQLYPWMWLVALALAMALPSVAEPEKAPTIQGELVEEDGVPVLRLWGTPRERGFAHGYLLAKDIVEGADKSLAGFLGGRKEIYLYRMLPVAKMAFRVSDEEKAELEGVLAGIEARLPEAKDRTITCVDRVAGYDDLMVMNVFGDIYALGCASLAIWGELTPDGKAMVARNFDFPALDLVVARQHVRIVAPVKESEAGGSRHGYVGVGYPGGIGVLTGLSTEGVFTAIHDVHVTPEMKDIAQGNVPRLIAIRRLLEQLEAKGAVEKATELCRGWNTLYGNNFMVATSDPGEGLAAGVLEYDTNEKDDRGVDLRGPEGSMLFVCCTNHHCTRGQGECWRFDRLSKAFAERDGEPVTPKELFGVVENSSFPKAGEKIEPGQLGTLHQVVAETGPRRLRVRLAKVGGHIKAVTPKTFDVAKEIADLAKR